MAPNVNVSKAFKAMKSLGISEDIVKPVLKNLLKLFDKNWDFIEAENYRALVDAIFEKQEGQVAQPENRNLDAVTQGAERKKKRRNEDVLVEVTKKKHLEANQEVNKEAEATGERDRPLKRLRLKYQENHVSDSSGCSKNLQLQTVNNSQLLLVPKDEPVSLPFFDSVNPKKRSNGVPDSSKLELAFSKSEELKISMTYISSNGTPNFHMPSLDELLKRAEDKCLKSYKFLDPSFSLGKILNDVCECALELGTSSNKESQEEINNIAPADDLLDKSTPMDADSVTKKPQTSQEEELGILSLSPASNGMDNTQDSSQVEESGILCLPPTSNGIGDGIFSVGEFTENEKNGINNADPSSLIVVELPDLVPLRTGSSNYVVNDISKGLESVVISVVNEVNNEFPPAFRYIPSNIKYENASVNFSLSRIGGGCLSCIGGCVSNICACSPAGVVYNIGGLVKDNFLEECISMNHGKQFLFYCKDCPLEKSKLEDAKEGCKGHLVRKFIKECWWKCGCNANCGNRVVQRGIRRNLQVFMTSKGKGWGLRTLEDLPKGAFVCEFVGEILTIKELYTRVSQTSNTEKYEFPMLLDADWNAKVMKDEEALCLDAAYYGNVARFINHRCFDANLVGIPVEVDTPEHHYYRFALFTTRKVDAMEELTRDYGTDFDDYGNQFKTFECLCESKFCRNLRRKTRSRSAKRRG